ncbi:hypothetical protein [Thermosporothrix hazakensis]|uniref:hypothetical protein n=1 Tax=Thermosporothrix hazakensis TaxID=644383 RepID=UPI001475F6DE|nr:hypothetical protein [Thermosporothrix hazakensis]
MLKKTKKWLNGAEKEVNSEPAIPVSEENRGISFQKEKAYSGSVFYATIKQIS